MTNIISADTVRGFFLLDPLLSQSRHFLVYQRATRMYLVHKDEAKPARVEKLGNECIESRDIVTWFRWFRCGKCCLRTNSPSWCRTSTWFGRVLCRWDGVGSFHEGNELWVAVVPLRQIVICFFMLAHYVQWALFAGVFAARKKHRDLSYSTCLDHHHHHHHHHPVQGRIMRRTMLNHAEWLTTWSFPR